MDIWARLFGSRNGGLLMAQPSGLLRDDGGWFYQESLDFAGGRQTLRIEQDKPGDWYVHDSNCRVLGINDPAREAEVAAFFGGTYRWLDLEPTFGGSPGRGSITVYGTFRNAMGEEKRVHLGFLSQELADALEKEVYGEIWGRIRCLGYPGRGRRAKYMIRFDLLVELDADTFE
jgi:hypothetical protein